jgi:hypothetical protein
VGNKSTLRLIMHYEHGKLCLGGLSCTPLQRRPVSAIDR